MHFQWPLKELLEGEQSRKEADQPTTNLNERSTTR